jgi:hypothetical protein
MKDNEDRALEALFASEPIADDGFSNRVLARVRRRVWIQRLALPTAFVAGLAIAAKPALEILGVLSGLATMLPLEAAPNVRSMVEAAGSMTNATTMVFVGVTAVAAMFLLPAFDDGV